jgi:hypothetical protein
MTYHNGAPEFIADIRTGKTYPNVASEFSSDIVLISEMNSVVTLG